MSAKAETKAALILIGLFITTVIGVKVTNSYLLPWLLEREHKAYVASHQYQEGIKEEITRLQLAISNVDEDLLTVELELLDLDGKTPESLKTIHSYNLVKKRLDNQKRRLQTQLQAVKEKGYRAQ